MSKFNYPVNDPFEARAVTEPTFEEDIFASNLYVDLDKVRGNEYLNDIKFDLGIGEDGSFHLTKEYVKLIFSGHIGSGKTIELKRLHQELNQPSQYFSVFISIEEELEISRFEPEDFYVLLITKLIRQLQENGISRNTESLNDLAKMFFSDIEVKKEISESIKDELTVNVEAGIGFFDFFKIGGSLKNLLAGETKTAKVIREVTRKNLLHLTQLLNYYLSDIRTDIQKEGLGQDILFIIDGTEKIMFEKYETLFVRDANVLIGINANMIVTVRIDGFYQVEKSPTQFTNRYVVPMIRTDKPENGKSLCRIIEKRINTNIFFENIQALDKCIYYSGGCIRQLFRIVSAAIRKTRGNSKINIAIVERVVDEIGNTMREGIDKSYIKILQDGDFEPAEIKVKAMLYSTLLLKYNGKSSIKINPILEKYLRNANEL
jgi:DNA polymerase III delta prime subunit